MLSKVAPTITSATFSYAPADLKIYCHENSINSYKQAQYWSNKSDYIYGDNVKLYFAMSSLAQKKTFTSKPYVDGEIERLSQTINNSQNNLNASINDIKVEVDNKINDIINNTDVKNIVRDVQVNGVSVVQEGGIAHISVDTVFTDLSEALNEIIALQEAYIGTTFDELHEYAQDIVGGGEEA